jgi:hypothetical protein
MSGFSNPIAGDGGSLQYPQIKSPDFVAGVSGWKISKDGSAEFNDITIRGGEVIDGTGLYYSPSPGTGNLVAAITGTGGTDQYGNPYLAGDGTYNFTNGRASVTWAGEVTQYILIAGAWTPVFTIGSNNGVSSILGAQAGQSLEIQPGAGGTLSLESVDVNNGLETDTFHATSGAEIDGVLALNGGSSTTPDAAMHTPGFANGTASQLTTDTTRDYMIYLQVNTPGTGYTIAIGPSTGSLDTIVGSCTPAAGRMDSFRLPAGWFVKWSGTGTTLSQQRAIGC